MGRRQGTSVSARTPVGSSRTPGPSARRHLQTWTRTATAPDALEDTNGDCTVGPDETDPRVADTDGDGLLDGDEDVDRDGVWDAAHGELNSRGRHRR